MTGLVDRHGAPLTTPPRKTYRIWPFVKPSVRALSLATGCQWHYSPPFTFVCQHGCMLPGYKMLTKGALHMEKQARAWHVHRLQPALLKAYKQLVVPR